MKTRMSLFSDCQAKTLWNCEENCSCIFVLENCRQKSLADKTALAANIKAWRKTTMFLYFCCFEKEIDAAVKKLVSLKGASCCECWSGISRHRQR